MFWLLAIAYAENWNDHWMKNIEVLFPKKKLTRKDSNKDKDSEFGRLLANEAWGKLTKLQLRDDIATSNLREQIALQSYDCVV